MGKYATKQASRKLILTGAIEAITEQFHKEISILTVDVSIAFT